MLLNGCCPPVSPRPRATRLHQLGERGRRGRCSPLGAGRVPVAGALVEWLSSAQEQQGSFLAVPETESESVVVLSARSSSSRSSRLADPAWVLRRVLLRLHRPASTPSPPAPSSPTAGRPLPLLLDPTLLLDGTPYPAVRLGARATDFKRMHALARPRCACSSTRPSSQSQAADPRASHLQERDRAAAQRSFFALRAGPFSLRRCAEMNLECSLIQERASERERGEREARRPGAAGGGTTLVASLPPGGRKPGRDLRAERVRGGDRHPRKARRVTRRPTRPSSLSLLPLTPPPSSLPPPSLFESLLTYSDNYSTTSLYDGHHRRRASPCARPDPLRPRLRDSPSSSRRRLHRHERASLGLRRHLGVRPSSSLARRARATSLRRVAPR